MQMRILSKECDAETIRVDYMDFLDSARQQGSDKTNSSSNYCNGSLVELDNSGKHQADSSSELLDFLKTPSLDMHRESLERRVHEIFVSNGIKPEFKESCLKFLGQLKQHDNDLYLHSMRVGLNSYDLSMYEGRPLDVNKLSFYGGLLHDVGKLGFSPELLHRDITAEEYELLKDHARLGYSILGNSFHLTAYVAGMHHQKPVGNGYGDVHEGKPLAMYPDNVKRIVEYASLLVGMMDFLDAMHSRDGKRKSGGSIDKSDVNGVSRAMSREYFGFDSDPVVNKRVDWFYSKNNLHKPFANAYK